MRMLLFQSMLIVPILIIAETWNDRPHSTFSDAQPVYMSRDSDGVAVVGAAGNYQSPNPPKVDPPKNENDGN